MSTDFKGKLAIVTGASKLNGIGYATAYVLAKGGADVCIISAERVVFFDLILIRV